MELRFDRFYRHAELTALLAGFAARNPRLFRVETIGMSHEGRDIQVIVAGNTATGEAETKRGFRVNANIHAAEPTGSGACLCIPDFLERGYGKDARVTRL